MAKNDFEHGGWSYYTLQCGTIKACGSGIMTVNSPSGSTCNVTRSSGIMTLNSPGGSTLQCGRRLWGDMPRNSPKHPPYLNSTAGFDFDHMTAVDMSSAPVCEILSKSDHPQQKKIMSCQFSRWRISAILEFMGPVMASLKSPCTTSYKSSIKIIALNCLVF